MIINAHAHRAAAFHQSPDMMSEHMAQPASNSASNVRTSQQTGDMQADIAELRQLLSERNEDPRKQRFRNMYCRASTMKSSRVASRDDVTAE
jgi:hypothetical protein